MRCWTASPSGCRSRSEQRSVSGAAPDAAGSTPKPRRFRRGMYATRWLPVVVVIASALVAVLPGPGWADLLLVNALVLAALGVDVWLAPATTGLQVSRTVPSVVSLDRPGTAQIRLHNPATRRVRVATREGAGPSAGVHPGRQALEVDPKSWVELEEEIAPTRRGLIPIGPLTVRTAGPLGLGGRQQTLPVMDEVKCYPALPGRRQVELRLDRARMLQSGERSSALRGGGGEFDALREYHPDDEFRRINWRATARAPKPISNTYREERNQQVLLLVDTSRTMAGTVAGAPRFEHALDAGIALAELAGRVGDHVGMTAFAGDVRVTVGPRSGRTQARRILDVLFNVHPTLDAPNYPRAFGLLLARYRRRALLVLLTELADPAAMEGLFLALPMLLARHLVVVAAVTDPAVEAEATSVPGSSEEAYAKAAAAGALAARAESTARLGALGVTVVDRPPGELAGALADQYLTIKSRGRL